MLKMHAGEPRLGDVTRPMENPHCFSCKGVCKCQEKCNCGAECRCCPQYIGREVTAEETARNPTIARDLPTHEGVMAKANTDPDHPSESLRVDRPPS